MDAFDKKNAIMKFKYIISLVDGSKGKEGGKRDTSPPPPQIGYNRIIFTSWIEFEFMFIFHISHNRKTHKNIYIQSE